MQLSLPTTTSVRWLSWLRRRIRSSELWLIAVATLIGAGAGALAVVQAKLAHGLQVLLFAINIDERLSAQSAIAPWRTLAIPLGGLVLGVASWAWLKYRPKPAVDPVEANALHGGHLSIRDSAFICGQTLLSNGVGASVGLEAAYAQAGAAIASFAGQRLNLRRADMRTLVGAGAGAAIAAAFGAPLTGAFYAFEIVIGAYTVANLAPVAAAALAAVLVAGRMGGLPYLLKTSTPAVQSWFDYGLYALLGVVCAFAGIALMRLVASAEGLVGKSKLPKTFRPMVGGMGLAALAMITPQTLSAGHGAVHVNLTADLGLKMLLILLAMKALASVVSLSFGFRGGLFFASLFLGVLVGQIFAALTVFVPWLPSLDPTVAALVGLGAFGVAVVGGPFTMSFLVLEATGDFTVAAAALVASLIASAIVRETFGYSFSTWRLHLRGETIRSAHDVSWMRPLTAGPDDAQGHQDHPRRGHPGRVPPPLPPGLDQAGGDPGRPGPLRRHRPHRPGLRPSRGQRDRRVLPGPLRRHRPDGRPVDQGGHAGLRPHPGRRTGGDRRQPRGDRHPVRGLCDPALRRGTGQGAAGADGGGGVGGDDLDVWLGDWRDGSLTALSGHS
jgi:CIC family chloride channel protein